MAGNGKYLARIPASEVIAILEWYPLKHDENWYNQLGHFLAETGNPIEALEYHRQGQTLNTEKEWNRSLLLRISYISVLASNSDFDGAIKMTEEVIAQVRASPMYSKLKIRGQHWEFDIRKFSVCLEMAAEWKGRMGENEAELDLLVESVSIFPYDDDTITTLIEKAVDLQKPKIAIQVLKDLAQTRPLVRGHPYSRFVEYIFSVCTEEETLTWIWRADLEAHGNADFTYNLCVEILEISRKSGEAGVLAALNLALARWYGTNFQPELAVELLQQNIDARPDPKSATFRSAFGSSVIYLSKELMTLICDPKTPTEDAKRYKSQLRILADQASAKITFASGSVLDLYVMSAKALTGLSLQIDGQFDEAKAYYLPLLEMALALLTDDTPDNDGQGLTYLMLAAMVLKDVEILKFYIWQITKVAVNHTQHINSAVPPPAPTLYTNRHGRVWQVIPGVRISLCINCFQELYNTPKVGYWCKYAVEDTICEDCMPLVREGKTTKRTCSQHHEWWELSIDDFPGPLAEGQTEEEEIRQFLEDVRKKYL